MGSKSVDKEKEKSEILAYLLNNLLRVVTEEELARFCASPQNVRQHIRRLQRSEGWPIQSGQTLLDMIEAREILCKESGIEGIGEIMPNDYVLVDDKLDPDAPGRWVIAERIRSHSNR